MPVLVVCSSMPAALVYARVFSANQHRPSLLSCPPASPPACLPCQSSRGALALNKISGANKRNYILAKIFAVVWRRLAFGLRSISRLPVVIYLGSAHKADRSIIGRPQNVGVIGMPGKLRDAAVDERKGGRRGCLFIKHPQWVSGRHDGWVARVWVA